MVALDSDGAVVRPALLWNDLRSAPQIAAVVEHLGGPERCADTIGSVPAASFTVTKLRWMAENEPANANLFAEHFPDAEVFFLETIHSPNPPALWPRIIRLKDFSY